MLCEMCNDKEACCRALVEGAELALCRGCSRFGKVTKEIRVEIPAKKQKALAAAKPPVLQKRKKEVVEVIASDFSSRIRKAREKLGLTQEEFAKKISEKASIVHKLETGVMEPGIGLAKKLEKVLRIKLVEEREESGGDEAIGGETTQKSSGSFTLGDFIKKS